MGLGLLAVVCALTSGSVEGLLSRYDFMIDAVGLLATCVFAAIVSRQRVTKERVRWVMELHAQDAGGQAPLDGDEDGRKYQATAVHHHFNGLQPQPLREEVRRLALS